MKDFYDLLDIKRYSSIKDVKERHRELLLKYHPDKNLVQKKESPEATSATSETETLFLSITEAWNILKDVKLKEEYDNELKHYLSRVLHICNEILCVDDLEEIEADEGNPASLVHVCRCSGLYIADVHELRSDLLPVEIPCESCSLWIKIVAKS